MVPFVLVAICSPIQQRVCSLVPQSDSTTAAHAYCHMPLGLQAHKEAEHTPVFRPDFYWVFPIVLGLKAFGHFWIWREIGNSGGSQFPWRPWMMTLR